MASNYYKPCKELDICNELIDKFFNTKQYEKCFEGHLSLAEQGYPLAECQIGYFYYDGLGVEKNPEKAVYWTRRSADHGDRDGQYNLAWFYEEAIGVEKDMEQAKFWYRKSALQNHDLAIEKCRELGIDLNAPLIDRETIRKNLQCRIYPLGYLERYKYTVICTSYQGKWILSRHKNRNTWETQGGHIEEGETPLECAKRELFEESGIQDAELYPVCDYWGFNTQACSNGMVFLAVVHSLGELPESEIKEIKVFDSLPEELTYPETSPKLFAEAEKLLMRCVGGDFMRNFYHGSIVSGITGLDARSKLHNSDEMVVYLTDNIPYALYYIWDEERNEYSGKYVTGWMKNGVAYYEEQFPDQLRTFYQGVSGYLYRIADRDDIKPVENRENMYYSKESVSVAETIKIDDVYEELLKYEAEGKFVVLRYNEQSAERQKELVEFIAQGLIRSGFFEGNKQKQEFMKKHFPRSWEMALSSK